MTMFDRITLAVLLILLTFAGEPAPDRVRIGTAAQLGYPKGFPVDEHWIALQAPMPVVSIVITKHGHDKGEQIWLVRIWHRRGVYDGLPSNHPLAFLPVNPPYAPQEADILLKK